MTLSNALANEEVSIEGARQLLKAIGFEGQQSNERSALTLMALCELKEGDLWKDARQPLLGITQIIDWIASQCGRQYAPNTRETIRDETVRFFLDAGLVVKNYDDPHRATNSPRTNYRITDASRVLIGSIGSPSFGKELERYRIAQSKVAQYVASRQNAARPVVMLPDDAGYVELSPGGQTHLIQAIIEEFCPRFAPCARVLFVDDAMQAVAVSARNEEEVRALETIEMSDAKPDVVLFDGECLCLIEACQTGGPIDEIRRSLLHDAFQGIGGQLRFVTCFESRRAMAKYLPQLAWGTEAWFADEPDCILALEVLPQKTR